MGATARGALVIVALSMGFLSCAIDVTDGDTQTESALSITLTWDPGTPSVDSYRLCWGTISGQYTQAVDVGLSYSATVAGLSAGETYYFAVTAVAAGEVSGYSNEVTYAAAW